MQYHYHIVYYFSTHDGYNGNGALSVSCDDELEYASDLTDAVNHIKEKQTFIKDAVITNIIPLKGFDRLENEKEKQPMKKIFEQSIETENPGMTDSTSHYDIEELYQAFKERIIEELGLNKNKEDKKPHQLGVK